MRLFLTTTFIVFISGCAAQAPMTLDERLKANHSTRNDVKDWDTAMKYRVSFQYANAALQQHKDPSIELPPDTTESFQVPFAIWQYSMSQYFDAGFSMVDWFNAGMSKENTYRFYFNRTLGFMATPNTHYFAFEESPRDGAISDLWDSAFDLYADLYNESGQCYMQGWTEELGYRRTFPKDVPNTYKEALYRCPHPFEEDQEIRVYVSAWKNPFNGVASMAAIQTQCWYKNGNDRWVDTRECGDAQAVQHLPYLEASNIDWMSLVVTPSTADPSRLTVKSTYQGNVTYLPAPEPNPDYQAFLASISTREDLR